MTSDQPPAFLTEADVPAQGLAWRQSIDAEYERNMEAPRDQAKKLQGVVLNLNEKMLALLEKEKQEFLAAYRAHTRKVQEDLAKLRAKVAEEEASFRKDEKLRKLQEDRDHYRDEALRLDGVSALMKKELKKMKAKLEVLEDDKSFLVKQLKSCTKDTEMIRSKVLQLNSNPETKSTQEVDDSMSQHSAPSLSTAELLDHLYSSVQDVRLPELPAQNSTSTNGFNPSQFMKHDKETVKLLRYEVNKLRQAVASERRSAQATESRVVQIQEERTKNWLLSCFVEHIRRAWSVIESRRRESELAASRSRSVQFGDESKLCKDLWGEDPLHFDWFTSTDRVAVMKGFLKDQRVLRALQNLNHSPQNA